MIIEPVKQRPFLWRHFSTITRFMGFVACGALWWSGISLMKGNDDPKMIAVYLLVCGVVVTFFELMFIMNKCICCREEGCAFKLWKYLLKIDNWKKFVLYAVLSIACFLRPKEFWEAVIAGVFLDISSLLYLTRSFRAKNEKQAYMYKQLEIR